jgi:hypothetical protein
MGISARSWDTLRVSASERCEAPVQLSGGSHTHLVALGVCEHPETRAGNVLGRLNDAAT